MAGKPIMMASPRIGRVIGRLSKNALADLVLDFIQSEIGRDGVPETELLSRLQARADAIAYFRGDRPLNLLELYSRSGTRESVLQ